MKLYLTEAHKIASEVTNLVTGREAVDKINQLRREALEEMRLAAETGDNDRYNELEAVRYDVLNVLRSVQSQMGKFAATKMAEKRAAK